MVQSSRAMLLFVFVFNSGCVAAFSETRLTRVSTDSSVVGSQVLARDRGAVVTEPALRVYGVAIEDGALVATVERAAGCADVRTTTRRVVETWKPVRRSAGGEPIHLGHAGALEIVLGALSPVLVPLSAAVGGVEYDEDVVETTFWIGVGLGSLLIASGIGDVLVHAFTEPEHHTRRVVERTPVGEPTPCRPEAVSGPVRVALGLRALTTRVADGRLRIATPIWSGADLLSETPMTLSTSDGERAPVPLSTADREALAARHVGPLAPRDLTARRVGLALVRVSDRDAPAPMDRDAALMTLVDGISAVAAGVTVFTGAQVPAADPDGVDVVLTVTVSDGPKGCRIDLVARPTHGAPSWVPARLEAPCGDTAAALERWLDAGAAPATDARRAATEAEPVGFPQNSASGIE